tara:strand:- start:173 stop:1171 length:999 start_codon:yes stop_codon:yes gene_type:complete
MTDLPAQDLYQIGSVTALTGIAAERLRAWERRYGFTPAQKRGKIRLYSHEQVKKLSKIKQLIDRGQSISSIIQLNPGQLDERLSQSDHAETPATRLGRPANLALIGAGVLQLEQLSPASQSLNVVGRWANVEGFLNDPNAPQADVIALQMPVLLPQLIAQVRDRQPNAAVLPIYQFATADQIRQCDESDMNAQRWPLSWRDIERQCLRLFGVPNLHGVSAPRLFSDEELIAIAVADNGAHTAAQQVVEQIHQLNALNSFLNVCGDEALSSGTSVYAHSLRHAASEIGQSRAITEAALQTLMQQQQQDPVRGANPLQNRDSAQQQHGSERPQH